MGPSQYSGGSAAQSASLQLLDAGLGVVHHGEEGEFLTRMRDEYMPPNQRDLIERVRGGASLKEICHGSLLEEVQEGYSACLEELVRFRTDHHRRRQVYPGTEGGQPGEEGGGAPGAAR